MDFMFSEISLHHYKIERDEVGRQEPVEILSAKDIKLALLLNSSQTWVRLQVMKKLEIDLPHKVTFSWLINEVSK